MRSPTISALACLLLCATSSFAAAPGSFLDPKPKPTGDVSGRTWSYEVAREYVGLAYASACAGDSIKKWNCGWCNAGYSEITYYEDAPTKGAAFTAYNAKTNQIFVVYRSTVLTEWRSIMVDFTFDKVAYTGEDKKEHGQVHKGFSSAYSALNARGLADGVAALIKAHPKSDLVIIGHSLGGALATFAAAQLSLKYPANKVIEYTFGSPRVGDRDFSEWFASLPVTYFRAVTADDPVPHVPKLIQGFVHVGSGQEQWFKKASDAKPQECPRGENADCANTVVAPTNFMGAHAKYYGYTFNQCDIGPLAEITKWTNAAIETLTDTAEDVAKATKEAKAEATETAKDAKETVEEKVEEKVDSAKKAAKKALGDKGSKCDKNSQCESKCCTLGRCNFAKFCGK